MQYPNFWLKIDTMFRYFLMIQIKKNQYTNLQSLISKRRGVIVQKKGKNRFLLKFSKMLSHIITLKNKKVLKSK
ncbi:MAG: hypothetical protein COZ16_03440 [Flavobacteriaceae bacterium CG_4_10_14_3_um_filter_31_253]|nr:MAG: hypothetical protein AUK46_08820 [Flavobacteriaceae bacterium CG2_30_31_66]PIV95680.1 MAG: hypothetical protein COW43_12015 [Flavobacteriaceae bacterium CG17_big_fil_post_rev_8_21_14_2_50_31_13]PIX14480.1 MAG: hypothetical protein COZ74_02885 [Flavobacteriaceae bacterium CG_4_8_14_3_um_filter_31_8]PIY15578.1 MAG: hypothetical protein COZ16_03440 [Flavobacteriaceae bacterium CG_4_10_14_3_um_filter_31_253]PIZ09249.1 MAG: hypothetical protein COY55_13605 [Flavobacteriaceae bacterium CG_4_1